MITVFGSINLDVIFRSEALPHAGQTVLAASMRTEPGGKGANQAVATLTDAVTRSVTAASLSCTRVGSQNSLPEARETDAALLRLVAH